MAEDEASETYKPDSDDTKTVKTLVNAIAGATLDCFSHCHAFDVVWDDGYDTLADSYKPKDGLRIYEKSSRLSALRKVLDYTANVPRFEADGNVHILKPITSGDTFDSEYSLEKGHHNFFSKAYRNSLVFPNKVIVKSRDGDDPPYSGEAQVDGYDSLPAKVKKTKYVQVRLESHDQAQDIAEALISKAEMGSKRGQAEVPLNVGAEVFDYDKVTDSRQGDTRTGNLGYIHRRFGKDKWIMTFGFGNWFDALRYQKMLKELETYTDAGQYFSRLSVGDLYAENLLAKNMGFYWIDPDNTIASDKLGPGFLDNLPDGEQFVRTSTWNMEFDEDPESPTYQKWVLKLDEHTAYQPGYDPTTKRRNFTAEPTTPYDLGDMWTDGTALKRCITARVTGAYQAGDWAQVSVDEIGDGATYQRVKSAALTAEGLVVLDTTVEGTFGLVKSTDISAGHIKLDTVVTGTYGLVKSTDISAGHIKLSYCYGDLDDIDDGGTYEKLRATDIDSGHIKLSSYTKVSGEWYDEAGVEIDANYGINIYGQNNALTTRASKTGAIQCYVGSDGAIYAGGGNVKLDSAGIKIKQSNLKFYYSFASPMTGIIGGFSSYLGIYSDDNKDLKVNSDHNLYLEADGNVFIDPGSSSYVEILSGTRIYGTYINMPRRSSPPATYQGRSYYPTDTGRWRCWDAVSSVWRYL
ncbi:hypothetical protein ES707_07815 [subsurface metagenome]